MKTLITTIFCLWAFESFGQHSLDSCKICHCKKWHQTFSVDSLTKEKIIIISKQKGNGCGYNNSNCKTLTVDGRCDYQYIISQYYNSGHLHKKTISKGWASGWGGKGKTTEIIYDTSGKQIKKTRKNDH